MTEYFIYQNGGKNAALHQRRSAYHQLTSPSLPSSHPPLSPRFARRAKSCASIAHYSGHSRPLTQSSTPTRHRSRNSRSRRSPNRWQRTSSQRSRLRRTRRSRRPKHALRPLARRAGWASASKRASRRIATRWRRTASQRHGSLTGGTI